MCHEKIDERFVVVIAAAFLVLRGGRIGWGFGYSLCWVRRVDVAVQLPYVTLLDLLLDLLLSFPSGFFLY